MICTLMQKACGKCLILFSIFLFSQCANKESRGEINSEKDSSAVELWVTSSDQSILLQKQPSPTFIDSTDNNFPTLSIDERKTYQTMDGFGYTLTGGSATLINGLKEEEKTALLKELFERDENSIGVSYLRLTIGASDLSDHLFTYNDLPPNQTDPELLKFNLNDEKKDLIPVLKEIVKIIPDIKILGSPWSAPIWMKTNKSYKGGSLKHEYFPSYAQYFVKYIQEMDKEGIKIDAITVQNEPLHPGNNPSMFMSPEDQALFVKKHLGPAFEKSNIKTKIILYDHNADRVDYPISILNDPEAKKYVDGSAFHLYGGKIEALSEVHKAHPDKHLYFTEQWVGAPQNFEKDFSWHVKTLIIEAPRNWCRNVLEWNLAADPNQDPHTDDGGCDRCLGALTIGNDVTRNVAYYIIAQASKFVPPGSVRVDSSLPENLPNVAYKRNDGKVALIVFNDEEKAKTFNVEFKGKTFIAKLNGKSAGTFVW